MNRKEIEAVAQVLWLQHWRDTVVPFPNAGPARDEYMRRAREVVYAYETAKASENGE
jgi:hypothetical protein